MKKTVFVADIHLEETRQDISELFFQLLARFQEEEVERCYILGDLFEYWLGDDCASLLAKKVAKHINQASQQGCEFYFIHGNRDFLIQQQYAASCNMQLLDEHVVIDLHGKPTLIAHGDTFCTDDIEYMAFREKVRGTDWQEKIQRLPKFIRKLKAKKLRKQSQTAKQNKTLTIMDVNQQTVERIMKQNHVLQLIHGHTHRPAVHQDFSIDGQPASRYVLGDWFQQGSVLLADNNGLHLLTLPLEKKDDFKLS